MAERIKLLFICLAVSLVAVGCANLVAQEIPVAVAEESILETGLDTDVPATSPQIVESNQPVVNTVPLESQTIVETAPQSDSDSPIVIPCADGDAEQCIVVKKSPLGCLEGIAILPQDEVWLLNARDFLCGETDLSKLTVSQIVGGELVSRELSDLTSAHASGDELSTVLYIHGNQTSKEFAIARGLQVYRNALAKKAHCHGPVRFVIWAWKSEQEKVRFYPDYLVKSERSVRLGETFAATLNQFSDRNLVVFGYSLGVQVALSAFDSPLLDSRIGDPTQYRAAFAAPAINANFVAYNSLSSGYESPIKQTLVFTNRKDRAIRAAQAIIRRKNPTKEATVAGLSDSGRLNI